MTKITLTQYQKMLEKFEEEYGVALDLTLADWKNPLVKDEDMPGLTLKWDHDENDWIVYGPLNQTVH
jgi:hypothetical protein|tara:strand:+ start:329 stop:529 length:201 start_codon:yes stop_codon:yes gene_type:complete